MVNAERQITLQDVLGAVAQYARTDAEAVAVIVHLLGTGTVRLRRGRLAVGRPRRRRPRSRVH